MRTTIFFILLSFILPCTTWSQWENPHLRIETEHFIINRSFGDGDSTDYLTLKYDNPPARWEAGMNNMYSIRFDENLTQQGFVAILRNEFIKPYLGAFLDSLSTDRLDSRRNIYVKYQFDIEQKFIGCFLRIPSGLFDRYPQLEPMLYDWAQAVKLFDFTRYKLNIWDKEKFGYGELVFTTSYYINWLDREQRKLPTN
ncbi:hypothetical protein [Parabacteroides distasonis]|uniref:Uncharacterized protein n=1 Tax=Parabacteroides distasonis TaxID=823 RepID=A0A4S2EKU2_PARDI|nr:hypothetical protein [Parabacteroides distasonis]TGY55073.1 hypothetical protein E5342_15525 [Parabacteroides distasonis]